MKYTRNKYKNIIVGKKCNILNKYTIMVTRQNKKGKLMDSKPCVDCLIIMKFFGIKNCIYSTNIGTMKKEKVVKMTTTHYSSSNRR